MTTSNQNVSLDDDVIKQFKLYMIPVVKTIQISSIDDKKLSQFNRDIREIVSSETQTDIVLVDLKDVTFMDSSGLDVLHLALKTVRASGGKFYLCSPNEQIKALFENFSLERVYEIFPTREDFDNWLKSDNI